MSDHRAELATRVAEVQAPILRDAGSCLTDRQVEALRCIVRLVVEFDDYLRAVRLDAITRPEFAYLCESIFAGVDSFSTLATGCQWLDDMTPSEIGASAVSNLHSVEDLARQYRSLYERFLAEAKFETRCRLVPDLFKLQLIFVGAMYQW